MTKTFITKDTRVDFDNNSNRQGCHDVIFLIEILKDAFAIEKKVKTRYWILLNHLHELFSNSFKKTVISFHSQIDFLLLKLYNNSCEVALDV